MTLTTDRWRDVHPIDFDGHVLRVQAKIWLDLS